PKIIVLHNIQSMLFRRIRQTYPATWEDRLFYRPELQKVIRYEKQFYSRYNLAITVSEADRQALGQLCPSLPAEVIPNGVDVSEFQPAAGTGRPGRTLIYFANYTTAPNADAIRYFCRQIFPAIRARQPDVRLRVVGNQPPPELARYEGVEVIGYVPDVRAAVAAADVVVVPLRVGGGTRLKIVEALALGKAVVSTSVGAEGLEVTPGRDILIADTPEAFAEATVSLLQQPDLRASLGRNGRRLAEQVYDWDLLASRVDRLYRQVARKPAMAGA
ncbi:MAG: glycosyltransferase, partial [Chloroflexi bacterium]